jgi:hypothetical protein
VKAAIEANKRLREAGKEEVLITAVRRRGEDADMFGVMASSFIRQGESPTGQARKIQRFLAMGRLESDAAIAFGVSRTTIRGRLDLLEASKPLQKAVDSGQVAIEECIRISKLPEDEQAAALEAVVATPVSARKEKTKELVPSGRPRMIGRKRITAVLDVLECVPNPPPAASVLRWILGQQTDFDEAAWIPE